MSLPTPSHDELSELLLCARYGDASDLDDIKAFVAKYGDQWLAEAKDERGNTCLHLAGANGHEGEREQSKEGSKSVLEDGTELQEEVWRVTGRSVELLRRPTSFWAGLAHCSSSSASTKRTPCKTFAGAAALRVGPLARRLATATA